MGEYSVVQFFVDETHEYVCRFVSAEKAVRVMLIYCRSVGAKIGTTRRVIITDGGDNIAAEWQFGQGMTYPTPEELAQEKHQEGNGK